MEGAMQLQFTSHHQVPCVCDILAQPIASSANDRRLRTPSMASHLLAGPHLHRTPGWAQLRHNRRCPNQTEALVLVGTRNKLSHTLLGYKLRKTWACDYMGCESHFPPDFHSHAYEAGY